MQSKIFEEIAIDAIKRFYKEHLDQDISINDIYVVWSCKTLQNNKALLSTNIPDTRYFEVTYNGDKKEIYVDAYLKELNKCISVENI